MLCLSITPSSLTPGNCWSFLPFLECHIIGITAFQNCFFYLVICTYVFFLSFHGLIAHLFLLLNSILLSGCTTVFYPFACQRWYFLLSFDNYDTCVRVLHGCAIAGSSSLFICVRNCQSLTEQLYYVYRHQQWVRVPISSSAVNVSVLDVGHSNRCVVICDYCFNLHFPNDM